MQQKEKEFVVILSRLPLRKTYRKHVFLISPFATVFSLDDKRKNESSLINLFFGFLTK
jgi:predicted ATPase